MSTMAEDYLKGHGGNVDKFVYMCRGGATMGQAFFDALSKEDQQKLADKGHDLSRIIHGPALLIIIDFLLGKAGQIPYDLAQRKIRHVFRNASFDKDGEGQVIIYTGYQWDESGNFLLPFEPPEESFEEVLETVAEDMQKKNPGWS